MSEQARILEAQKKDAAERAVQLVESGMVVGLGTGSTAKFAIEAISNDLKSGRLTDIHGIPTSRRTQEMAFALGIQLSTLDEHPDVDITIDGADEVDAEGNLIKGGGGALLREKIVASATRRYVIIVDDTKVVQRLGAAFPVPVEVVKFGWKTHVAPIQSLGAEPSLRRDPTGAPYRTAAGHYILDCQFEGGLDDCHAVHDSLKSRAGVVETGLFLGLTPDVIVGEG